MARAVKPVFHLHGQGAAQCVQSEQGVGAADEVDAVNGGLWQQVPVHRIAQRLVDADAVLINRHPLGQAQQWRGGVAAILHIWLQWVVLGVVMGDAPQVVSEEVR